jgi:hypothetical protein
MAVTRTYTYLGKIKNELGEELHMWRGVYTAEAADTYDRDARPTLTFNGLSRILYDNDGTTESYGVLALYADAATLLSNPPALVSVTNAAGAAPILTFGVLASAADGSPFGEKVDDEAYGRDVNFTAIVVGH